MSRKKLLGCAAAAAVLTLANDAWAKPRPFDLPPQDAVKAIPEFARQAGLQIVAPAGKLRGVRTPAIHGVMEPRDALRVLLQGTGLEVASDNGSLVTLTMYAAAPVSANATMAASEVVSVEDVVVTANRREQKLVDVPMSVSALSQADIDRQGIHSIFDLSRAVPGLTVSESSPGQTRIFMRGVGNANSTTALVGIYVDEIPVTGASIGQLDLQLVDLERVEVLRGPQGTLYGQGSAGGTLRFITRSPDLTEVSGRVDVSAYGVDHGAASEVVTGVVNLPVVKDVFGLRVSGTFADIGGWVDQPAAGRKDINNQNLRNIRVKALFQPTDRFKVEGTVVVHRNDGDGIAGGADADYNISYPNGDPLAKQFFVDDYNLYNVTASYDFGPATLLSSTSHIDSNKHTVGGSTRVPGLETFNDDTFDNRVFTQEVRLSSSGSERLNWVVGGFYDDETLNRSLGLNLYSAGVSLGSLLLPDTETTRSWSGFGDASYALTDRLRLGTGLRYFHDDRTSSDGVTVLSNTFTSTDPRFYLSYDLATSVRLYANVAKGFRSGGFAGDTTATTFGPENIWSYEVGIKGARSRIRWELTGFFSQYKGVQAFALTSGVLGGLVNAGDADIKGVDALVAFEATDHLTLQASGNLTHTELVKLDPTTFANILGDRLDLIPNYSVSLSAEYRFEWAHGFPGFGRVDFNQIGPSTFTDRSIPVLFKSDTISLLNARIGVEHDRWSMELFAQNILGENGTLDGMSGIGLGARARPRVMGVKLGTSF